MSKNTTVSLTLKLTGNAGAQLKQINTEQIKDTQRINQQWGVAVRTTGQFVQNIQRLAPLSAQQIQNARQFADQLKRQGAELQTQQQLMKVQNTARSLGIRTEQQIHAEIRQTRDTYTQLSKLQATGLVTARDMAHAYTAMTARVQQLNRELGKTVQTEKTLQQQQKGQNRWTTAGSLAIGAGVGAAILKQPLQTARTYDQQLTYIASTATGGQGMPTAQRLASKDTLNQYIKDAVRTGGGTREDAAAALAELIGSGKYNINTVHPALTAASKTAFATGAAATDAAALTVRMSDFGITDLQRGHDIAVRGGQLGSFEYKDQAKWLAQQMAAARAIGYSGEQGLIKLVSLNQLSKTTAATSDEAGNNVVNLLAKLSSREFSDSLGKAVRLEKGDPISWTGSGKKRAAEFDWARYSTQQREQGVYAVDAFVGILERQLSGNKRYTALQAQAKSAATPAARKAALEDMSNIAVGSEIGKIIADRQALMAALAAVYNKDRGQQIESELPKAGGTTYADLDMVRNTEWAKAQALEQEKLFANAALYEKVSGALAGMESVLINTAQKHEGLATAAYGATLALGALAGVAGAASIAKMATGGGGVLSGASVASVAGTAATAARSAGVVGLVGGLAYGGATLARYGYMQTETGQQFDNWLGGNIADVLAALGSDTAQQAKFDEMIQVQKQQLEEQRRANAKKMIAELSGSDLMFSMSDQLNQQQHRGSPWRP